MDLYNMFQSLKGKVQHELVDEPALRYVERFVSIPQR